MTLRQAVRGVPQPWKRWLARFVMALSFPPLLLVGSLIDAGKYLVEASKEGCEYWQNARNW